MKKNSFCQVIIKVHAKENCFFQPYGDVGDGHAAASSRTFPDALSAYSLEGGTLFDFVSQ